MHKASSERKRKDAKAVGWVTRGRGRTVKEEEEARGFCIFKKENNPVELLFLFYVFKKKGLNWEVREGIFHINPYSGMVRPERVKMF